ncbi:porin family protein [Myxococcus landrumensis]|uniref:Porin family protein n=1 Tax=Myxococcus landrumensis TaxID=2813577 RepID=A0ABX7N5U2_9BACT|nr:porin family protein [Myxococcus landrumus]QSQ13836.1 porin family protein [Myxococcus landrumus]
MKSRTQWMLCSLSFALAASPALAEEGEDTDSSYSDDAGGSSEGGGFALGLRAGLGVPFGKFTSAESATTSNKVSDSFSAAIPLQLEAGYFFNPNIYVGAYFQYGILTLKEDCPDGLDCSASQLRFGANVAYHFQATPKIDPWVGLGIGYEIASQSTSATVGNAEIDLTANVKGLEFVSGQGGVDFRITPSFSVGPYVTYTLGQYSSISISGDDGNSESDDSTDIEEKAMHSWLYGGVRMQMRF